MAVDSVRLRVTLTVEYDADPADYDTDDPADMADIDERNYRSYPGSVVDDFLVGDPIRIDVTPVDGRRAIDPRTAALLEVLDLIEDALTDHAGASDFDLAAHSALSMVYLSTRELLEGPSIQ